MILYRFFKLRTVNADMLLFLFRKPFADMLQLKLNVSEKALKALPTTHVFIRPPSLASLNLRKALGVSFLNKIQPCNSRLRHLQHQPSNLISHEIGPVPPRSTNRQTLQS